MYFLTDAIILLLTEHCRNLVNIQFDPTDVNNATLTKFFSRCGSNLESLQWHYHDRYDFGDKDFIDYLQFCPKLKVIPPIITCNSELLAASQYCPNLIELVIDRSQDAISVTLEMQGSSCNNASLIAFFQRCHKVESVTQYSCEQFFRVNNDCSFSNVS